MQQTTQAILDQLAESIFAAYKSALDPLPMKKTVREPLYDGYRQGVRDGIRHVIGMLEIKVEK